jgi:hypothetical protein
MQGFTSLDMWSLMLRINDKIKSTSDLLFIIRLLDATARQRNEADLPVYPLELPIQSSGQETPEAVSGMPKSSEQTNGLQSNDVELDNVEADLSSEDDVSTDVEGDVECDSGRRFANQ